MMKNLIIALSLLTAPLNGVLAVTKADQITTNNPAKATVDFLKDVDIQTTGGLYLPAGTEAQRPTPIKEGLIRFNSDTKKPEVYANGEWALVGSGGGIVEWEPSTDYVAKDVVFNGVKIYYANTDFTSGPTFNPSDWTELSPMDVSNLVDRTTNQTIGGDKTFVNDVNVNGITSLNSSLNGPLKATGGVVNSGKINAASEVTGVLPIANGGTGTSIKNFVDLTSSQSVGGNKSFQNGVAVQGDLLTYGAVQTTLNEGMVSTDAAGNLIKGVLRPEIDLENQRLGFNYGGNDNLIPNGSFENTVAEDNWNCSSGVGTVGESNVSVADGVKSLKVGLGTGASYCYQDNIVIPSANVGKEHIYSITASSDRMLDFCAVGSSLDQNCVRYNPGNGPQLLTTFYTPTATTGNGLIIKSVNLLAGDMYIDKASMKVVTPSENSKSISNLNSLTDPSFEKGLVVGWQLSGAGSLTASATEVLELPRNKKALMVDSSTTTNVLTANWSTAIPPAGVSGVCSGWVKTPNALTAEVVSNSTRIASKAIEGTNVWQYFEMYFKTDGTHTPTCRFLNATATIYHLDEMFFGLKESPINITSFKNDGSWQPVTLSSTGNINYSILNSFKQRSGDKLLLKGTLTWTGAGNANQIVISLPDNLTANIPDNTFINGLEYVRAVNEVGIIKTSGSGKTITLTGMRNYDGQSAIQDNGLFNSVFASGNTIPFYVSIPIAEWAENTNGALVTCKEGPLKCANKYTATVINNVVTYNDQNNWISSATYSGGTHTINFNSAMGLTVPPTCIFRRYLANTTWSTQTDGGSVGLTTSTQTRFFSTNVAAQLDYVIECTKSFPDYNAGYEKVLGFTEDADIRSTEWLTGGFDYISGKPIYKRCHKFTANTYTSGVNFTNWGTGLRIVGNPVTKQDSGYYILDQASFLDGGTLRVFSVLYEPSNGNVYSLAVNPLLNNGVRAGDVICANYTKP